MLGPTEIPAPPAPRPRHPCAWPLLVVITTIAVYVPAVFNDFVAWDDLTLIVHNPRFDPPSWAGVAYYWTHPFFNIYQPLACTLWALLAWAGWSSAADANGAHMNPYVFHAAAVALHAMAALAAWVILRRALRGAARPAAIGALLFALHPIQVETVAFAGILNNALCGALSLTAIAIYLAAVAPHTHRTRAIRSFRLYAAAIVTLILAMLAKPAAVVIPLVAIVLDLAIHRPPLARAIARGAPLLALMLPCAIAAVAFQPAQHVAATPLWLRPPIAADAVCFYLRQIVLPLRLGIDYGRSPQVIAHYPTPLLAVSMLVVALMLAAAVGLWRRQPILAASILVFLTALLPNSGILRFDFQKYSTVADRYTYLAMLGPAMAAGWLAAAARSRPTTILATLILATLAIQTERQIQTWRDGPTLFRHAIAVNPNSWVAYSNLSAILTDIQPAEADADAHRAVHLNPDDASSWNNLGSILAARGQLAAAAAAFATAHLLSPDVQVFADNARRAALAARKPARR